MSESRGSVHGYRIEVQIKDISYTDNMRHVRIVSAINTPWQIVTLRISLDPTDLILDDVIGKEPIKMSIKLVAEGQNEIPEESIDLQLQHIQTISSTTCKEQQSSGSMMDRTLVDIITVCRTPFKIMTTIVNDVFLEKTPKEILTDLITKAGGTPKYDSDGENTKVIDQLVLPPTTLYNTISYLDNYFGLFNGISNLGFCQYDSTVHIQNLTQRINKNQVFTMYQLALNDPDTEEIINSCSDGKRFYTYEPLKLEYSGSAKFATLSKNVNHIVKPKDKLYRIIKQDLKEVCLNYGLIAKNPQIRVDVNLEDREVYNIRHSGNDESDVYANSIIARELVALSTIEINIEKKFPILQLVKIGEPVKLKPRTMEHTVYGDKYILKSSDLVFTRDTPRWQGVATIVLMRTNQYI